MQEISIQTHTDGKYQQRIRYIVDQVRTVNGLFDMPERFDGNSDLALDAIREAAEAVNVTIPSTFSPEQVKDRVLRITTAVKRKQRFATWPSIAMWSEISEKEQDRYIKDGKKHAAVTDSPKAGEWGSPEYWEGLEAKRIREGTEAVPETYVWGSGYHRLIASGQITEADIQPYRKWSRYSMEKLYGPEETEAFIEEKVRHGLSVAQDEDPSPQRREQMRGECERLTEKLAKQIKTQSRKPKAKEPERPDLKRMSVDELLEYVRANPTKARPETINSLGDEK